MNQNFLIKFLTIIFIFSLLIIQFIPISLSAGGLDDVISGGDDFLLASNGEAQKLATDRMQDVSNTIYNILLGTGIIIAVVVATILGIQYMTSAAEDKAQVKESMIPFIVGCVVVFGAFAIWKAFVLAFK